MATLNQMFPRKYATGEDLKGRAVTVTIKTVTAEKMRPSKEAAEQTKWVLHFAESAKGVILSRTLAHQIAAAIGAQPDDDTSAWTGKRVVLYPEPMTVAGKNRIAIRARAAAPNGNGHAPDLVPAPAQPGAQDTRARFYELSSQAISSGRLTAAQANNLVTRANGAGFDAALAELQKLLS